MMETNTQKAPAAVLVAMDFSPGARRALDSVLSWCPQGEITALYVLDRDFAVRVEAAGLSSSAEVLTRLRSRAEEEFTWLGQEKGREAFAPMIVEGTPFVEIVKIAKDLEVDLIAMGRHKAGARVTEMLFGSTADKVLRASPCPVLCIP